LLLGGDGTIQRGYDSVYVDGFALLGLAELWRATGREEIRDLAMQTFQAAKTAINHRLPPPAWPYPIPPGRISHGISMLFSHAFFELAQVTGDRQAHTEAYRHHQRIMECFRVGDPPRVFEWLRADGERLDGPAGRVIVPGHAIESMWMQIHIAIVRQDRQTAMQAVEAIREHLELGWDEDVGGLFLAVDADGDRHVDWPHADTKLWWPHVEALYATLLCYEVCGDAWCLEWHERIRDWSFAHFPDKTHGEWHQKLDREGRVIADTLFLPVKDPFHLPRALILCIDVLERLRDSTAELPEGKKA
jgi:N-acylglucosamine 2-epimerase